jgi:hypothetical protein
MPEISRQRKCANLQTKMGPPRQPGTSASCTFPRSFVFQVTLEDFTLEQVTDLNRRYGRPLRNASESGHSYLSQRGMNAMISQRLPPLTETVIDVVSVRDAML